MRFAQWTWFGTLVTAALLQVAVAGEPGQPAHVATLPQHDRFLDPAWGAPVSVSGDGSHVAFVSRAPLVDADTSVGADIYVLDRATGEVTLETLTTDGQASNGDSDEPSLDGSGRYLVFSSVATNLVDPRLASTAMRVFLRDRLQRTTRLLSIDRNGRRPPRPGDVSTGAVLSRDGRTVAFASNMMGPVAGEDRNGARSDVYLVRPATAEIHRVSLTNDGEERAAGTSVTPSLSSDGRFVAFTSTADLTCPQAEACARGKRAAQERAEVYVRDTRAGRTVRVGRAKNGQEPDGASFHPAISADGRLVAFASDASNLVANDRNRTTDVFVADLADGTIELVSRTPRGRAGNGRSTRPVIAGDGLLVAFQSEASDLVCASRCAPNERDINMVWDVFLHDRRRGTTVRVSADGGPEWMEPSGSPALAAFAPLVAFSSRHPIRASDRAVESNTYLVRPRLDDLSVGGRDKTPRGGGQR